MCGARSGISRMCRPPRLSCAALTSRGSITRRLNWLKDPAFSETERAVLNFTEWYHASPQSIPDDVAGEVIARLGQSGYVALIEALGFIDGRIRVALMYSRMEE